MIRCCSKFFIPLPSHNNGGPVCFNRIYVASSCRDFNQRRYASGENRPPRMFRKFFYTTVGMTLVGVGGVVVYAKSDPKFRKVLDTYLPGSDKFIGIIYQEAGSFNIDFAEQIKPIQDKILSFPSEIYKQISGTSVEESPSVIPKAKELKSEEVSKSKPEPAVNTSKKPPVLYEVASGAELRDFGNEGIKYYNTLISYLEGKTNKVLNIIDKLEESPDEKKWKEAHEEIDKIYKLYGEVKHDISEAREKQRKFSDKLSKEIVKKRLSADEVSELKTLESELVKAHSKVEDLLKNKFIVSINYFNKIEEERKRFSDELSTLFPKTMPGGTGVKLDKDEIDRFLYYTYQKIIYYQKELKKMEDMLHQKLDKAIDSKTDSQLIKTAISAKVEEAKRRLKEDYDKKVLELKQGCDQEVHDQMMRQEQMHLDLLQEQLARKEKEVERKLLQRMEAKLLEEQGRLQAELADMTGRMKGLNEAIARRALQDQKALTSQALWSAAEALHDDLKRSKKKEGENCAKLVSISVETIRNAAAKGDDLVETVLATIPSVAIKRGVYPEDALRERFLKVEKVAWKVAGVPEGGASLPKLLVAWLQSSLVMKSSDPIPPAELNNEPFDPSSLNNYDILQRARYWVDRGDYEQALKYMNLLKGGARAIASDWMKEATILLETQQAANLLLAHASASGMIYS